jgi:phospholipid-translocating ATPase
LANVYFLFSAILNSIPAISPLSPVSSIMPLVFVIALSMIREAYEDLMRHKSDIEVNASETEKWNDGGWV